VQRGAALRLQSQLVAARVEQALILRQSVLDLGIARQGTGIGNPETLGRLALGGQEIVDAVLDHDARRLLGERAAQIVLSG
jgi:hypothetical protein